MLRKPSSSSTTSPLDYLAWEIVKASGIKSPTSSTAFLIFEQVPTTTKQIERYERQVNGMCEEAKRAIWGHTEERTIFSECSISSTTSTSIERCCYRNGSNLQPAC